MKATIELEYDQIQSIIVQELKETLEIMMRDLVDRQSDTFGSGGIFDNDKETDIKLIKKHIKSLKRIIQYYGG